MDIFPGKSCALYAFRSQRKIEGYHALENNYVKAVKIKFLWHLQITENKINHKFSNVLIWHPKFAFRVNFVQISALKKSRFCSVFYFYL